VEYLESLRQTAAMPLRRLMTGHGEQVTEHAELVGERLAEHHARCRRIVSVLEDGSSNAWDIARRLWSPRTVTEQPLLVVWEVLGHLDLLIDAGIVREEISDDGTTYGVASFALATTTPTPSP
jgi:hypothetical protein